ncbi:MAG: SRPBCC family protein [Candidatus Eisenbacteria bacterium]
MKWMLRVVGVLVGLLVVAADTTTAMGVGHREVWVMNDPKEKEPMRIQAVVTAEEAPRTGAAHLEVPGMFTGDVRYTLTDLGNGRTRLNQKSSFHYLNPLFALMEPLITPEANKKQDADFARLKAMAEAAAD